MNSPGRVEGSSISSRHGGISIGNHSNDQQQRQQQRQHDDVNGKLGGSSEDFGGVPAGRHNVSRHSVGTVEGVGLGVVRGLCKSVLVESLSIADVTTTQHKATTYDNDNDNDDEA